MTKQHLDRLQAWRLKILQHAQSTGNVAKTCRHFGISRMVYYNWLKRYQQEGMAGLRDKPLGPHHCPHQTSQEIIDKILHLRRHYHTRYLETIGRNLQKKRRIAKERCAEKRSAFRQAIAGVPLEKLVFLDECGFALSLHRLYGWAPKGERCFETVPFNKSKNRSEPPP